MSHDYAGSINLHNRKKPVAQYSEGQLKGGIKREELSEKSRLIFDAINNRDESQGNVDDILDANEMQSFWDKLREYAKDDTLGRREAGRLLKDIGLKELKKEDLYAFITELYGESEDIESSLVDENDGTIIINYKKDEEGNVVQERVHTDHTSEIETTDAQETVTTQFINADDKLTKKTVVDKENNSTTTLYTDEKGNVVLDVEGNEVPTTVIQADAEEEIYRQTVNYDTNDDGTLVYNEQGQPVPAKLVVVDNRTKTPPATTTTTNYENGVPANATVVHGAKTLNYVYKENKPVLTNTVEDLGNGLQRTTDFEYNEQGHIEHVTEPGRTIDRTIVNFSAENNTVVPLTTQEIIKEGTTTTTNVFDYKQGLKQETIVEEGGKQTQNIYGIVPNEEEGGLNFVKLQQTKVVDGKTYQVQYDGEGNTCGIVVQFDNKEMSVSSFCRKFGIDENKFRQINGLKPRQKNLQVGQEVKIPKELEADAKILRGRDSQKVAIQKYQRHQQWLARDKQLRAMGLRDYKRAGETFTYGGKTYKVLGTKTNRARLLVQDSEGRVYTASHDNLILEDGYIGRTDYYDFHPERRIEIGGKTYVKAPDDPNVDPNTPQANRKSNGYRGADGQYHRDQYGRDVVIDYNGNIGVASGSIDHGHSQGRYILSSNYLAASDKFVDSKGTAGSSCYGVNGTRAVTVNGETFYFATNGFVQQNTETVETQIANNITADIIDAADGCGTKNEKLEGALSAILTPSIKVKVDRGIRAHGDSDWRDCETLVWDESDGERYYRQMNCLVTSGAYTETERGNKVATLLDYELHGGLGITRDGCVREILTSIDTPERRQAVDSALAGMDRYSGLQAYEGSITLAAISADGFENPETDTFGLQIVKQGGYQEAILRRDAEGQPVRDAEGNPVYENAGEQQFINNMVGRMAFSYYDEAVQKYEQQGYTHDQAVLKAQEDTKEYLHTALDAINTDNFNTQGPSATYLYFADRCAVENASHGYQEHFTDQEAVDVFIYGRSSNSNGLDLDQNEACFTLLYNDEWPPRTVAECALSRAREGDYTQLFTSTDQSVYDIIETELNAGEVSGCTSLQQLYQTAKKQSGSNSLSIEAGALLSGRIPFTKQEKIDLCVRIIQAQHDNKSGEATAVASGIAGSPGVIKDNLKYYQQLLYDIISTNPDIAEEVKQKVQSLNLEYFNGNTTFGGSSMSDMKSDILSQIDTAHNEAISISNEQSFTDENGNLITDPQEIARITNENKASLDRLRTYVATLERAYRMGVDKEGKLSDVANALLHNYGCGTDRFDVEQEYRNAKRLLSRFEAAAEGRLRDNHGNIITLRDLSEQTLASCQNLENTNNSYQTSISYAKMGIVLAPVILVTTVVSGGAAAVGWGTGATALVAGGATFATEYGLNMLELSTSETGNTTEARWNALEQAFIDGASVVVGAKATELAHMIKLKNPAIQGISRLSTIVASDVGMGAAGEYLISGEVTVDGVVMNAIFSATGNLIGYKSLNHSPDPHAKNLLDDIPDVGAHNQPAQPSQSVLDVATVDGTALPGGKFNPTKYGQALSETQALVANGLTPEQHVHLLEEASLLQGSGPGAGSQGKDIKKVIEDGTGVFTSKHGDIDINAETDIARLQEFRQEVAGWNDPNRDIDGILAMIDGRIEHLNTHPELIGTPVQSQVLDLYNQNLVQQTDALLAPTGKNGKNFKIGEGDASLIIERINKTGSLDELDDIVAGIEHRRLGGTRQDLIDNMMKAVESRRLQLRPEIDMDGFNTLMASKTTSGKGLNEGEVFDVVRLIENSTDEEFAQIETLINSNKKIKKQSQIKNAIETRKAKVGETPVHSATHAEDPVVEPTHVDEPAHVDDSAHVDDPVHVDETPIEPTHVDEPTSHVDETPVEPVHVDEPTVEPTPAHVDDSPSVPKTKEQIRQSVAQDVVSLDAEIPTAHQATWANIKHELNELQTAFVNSTKHLGQRCQAVLQNMQHLVSNLSGSARTKLQNLIADFKLQLMDYGIMNPKNCTLVHTATGGDGALKTIEITYDAKGLKTKQVLKNQNGTLEGEYTYTYDANNKVKTEVLKDSKGNTTENYYENGELVKTIEKDVNGNVLSDSSVEPEIVATVADDVIVPEVVEPEAVVHGTDIDDVIVADAVPVAEVVHAEPVVVTNPHLTDKTFVAVEALNPNDVKASLIADGISPQQKLINGNGAIKYTKDGVTYQMHYEDGKLTALRVKDASGNKSYYAYDSTGNRTQISHDEFMVLKGASDAKFNSSLDNINTPTSPDIEVAEVVHAEPVVDVVAPASSHTPAGTTPTNPNPKIATMIDKYRKKASHITTETFTIDGKPTEFEVFYGSKDKGSNTGYYVVNKETGDLYYAKIPSGGTQWKAEVAATRLYQAAGIDAPEISMFTANGKEGVLSKFIPDLQALDHPHLLANDGFGMDVLLENWDSIGLEFDNTLITADGTKVIKLDNGGSFDFKAQGGNKPFTAIPMELISMVDPHINPQASKVFGKMSRNDLISSLEKATKLKDVDIDNILNQCGCPQYAETLKKRRAFIQQVVDEMKNTPQMPGESTLAYMQKVTHSSLEKSIANATTPAELNEISEALNSIKDPAVKNALQAKLSQKLTNITSPTPVHHTAEDAVDVVEVEPAHVVDVDDDLVVEALQDISDFHIGDALPAKKGVVVPADTKLKLADQFEIDFNHPALKAKLSKLNDGDVLIIGREPGPDGYPIPGAFQGVSRKHLEIRKFGDEFVVTDISKYGTKYAGTSATAKTSVTIGTNGNTHLSNTDVQNLLVKSGYTKNPDGTYRFNVDSSFENELVNHFGYSYGNQAKKLYQHTLTAQDVDNITMMINEASKVIDVSDLEMNRIVLLYNSIQNGNTKLFLPQNISKMTPAKWAMVMNCAKGKTISASQLEALMNYKGSSSTINSGLSTLNNKGSVPDYVQKQIDDLTAYIDTQIISEDINLKRIEGYYVAGPSDNPYGCLCSTDYNGRPLSQVLDEAIAGGPNSIKAIEQEINIGMDSDGNLINIVAQNERFTSACVLPEAINNSTGGGKIVWDLTLKKGSKAAFLEGNNFGGGLSSECEILLQRDSYFKITNIKWDETIGKWIVKADVTSYPPPGWNTKSK